MAYLETEVLQDHSKPIALIPPSFAQIIKLLPGDAKDSLETLGAIGKDLILVPVNDHGAVVPGGAHWSLLAYCRAENAFYGYDSIKELNGPATKDLVISLKKALGCSSAAYVRGECLPQFNGYDCGVHTVANAEMRFNVTDELFDSIECYRNNKALGCTSEDFVCGKCLKQHNGYDCGVHI